MTPRSLLARACVLAALASPSIAAAEEACRDRITPELARALFDALKGPAGADGCALAGADTEQWRMDVRWEQAGRALPPARVEPIACARAPRAAGPIVALSAPEDLVRSCPDAVARMEAAVRVTAVRMARAHGEVLSWPLRAAVTAWAAIAAVLLAAAAIAYRVLRRGVG